LSSQHFDWTVQGCLGKNLYKVNLTTFEVVQENENERKMDSAPINYRSVGFLVVDSMSLPAAMDIKTSFIF